MLDVSTVSLIIPALIAGILTFLAPCTLPLVPGYLGFISGASLEDLKDPKKAKVARWKIFSNAILYVFGFSSVFIILGSLFGLGGVSLAAYRLWLSRIGGIFVIIFGLFMLDVFKFQGFNFLEKLGSSRILKSLKPGTPSSSFIFGATFAFGWTPCVGRYWGQSLP